MKKLFYLLPFIFVANVGAASLNLNVSGGGVDNNSVGTAQIINSTISLVDLNTTDIDTHYLTTATAQTISAAKTFSGVNVYNNAAQTYNQDTTITGPSNGTLKWSAPAASQFGIRSSDVNNAAYLLLQDGTGSIGYFSGNGGSAVTRPNGFDFINQRSNGTMNFMTNNAANFAMTISAGGNVGINPGTAGSVPSKLNLSSGVFTIDGNSGGITFNGAAQTLTLSTATNAAAGITNPLVSTGTVVANTKVTANTFIFLTSGPTAETGVLRVTAVSAGVSFTVASSVGTDTRTVNYLLVEPKP